MALLEPELSLLSRSGGLWLIPRPFHVPCAMAMLQPQSNAAVRCGLLPCTCFFCKAHHTPRNQLGKGSFGLPILSFQVLPTEPDPGPFQGPIEPGFPREKKVVSVHDRRSPSGAIGAHFSCLSTRLVRRIGAEQFGRDESSIDNSFGFGRGATA